MEFIKYLLLIKLPQLLVAFSSLKIIARSEWVAQPANPGVQLLQLPVTRIIIASTETENCTIPGDCIRLVRFLQTYFLESNNLLDIAYNFLVGGDGLAYEGRGWDKEGAHTKGYNKHSLGIAFIGTFGLYAPGEQQLLAAKQLINNGIALNKISPHYKLYWQNKLNVYESTTSVKLYELIKQWDHFTDELPSDDILTDENSSLKFVTRSEWLARPPNPGVNQLELPSLKVIIAHTATDECMDQATCTHFVRQIQNFHMNSRGWSDISYNVMVAGDGSAYEGRGFDLEGAHTRGFNTRSICIAFIGTFNIIVPPDRQIIAAKKVIREAINLNKLITNYTLYGHRQLISTQSPGSALYAIIKTWDHWTNKI